jgi:hypothetical protein
MSVEPSVAANHTLKGIRRIAIVFIIVSLSITALVGIVTLLTASFGEVQAKVLLTTLLMAGFSITALCHLAVVGRALQVVGFVGIATSALAFFTGAYLIWSSWDNWSQSWESVLKTFAVLGVLAVSLSHANLLLLLAGRRNPLIRTGLFVTVGLIGLLAALIIVPIVTNGEIPGENELYWRFLGVVAILDVLGTIVLPVINRFARDGGPIVVVHLEVDAAAKVDRIAAARGLSRDAVVAAAIADLPE